jgi:hypothetical protein
LLVRDAEENDDFLRPAVTKLIEDLEEVPLHSLTENENQQLLVFLQTALDVRFRLYPSFILLILPRLTNTVEH